MSEFYNESGQLNDPAEQPVNPAELLPINDLCDEIIEQCGSDRSNERSRRFDAIWNDDSLGIRLHLVKLVHPAESSYLLSLASQFESDAHAWYAYRGTPPVVQVCDGQWKKQRGQPWQQDLRQLMRSYLATAPVAFSGEHSRAAISKTFDELVCIYALTDDSIKPHVARLLERPAGREGLIARTRAKMALKEKYSLTGKQAVWAMQVARELEFPESKND